MVGQEDKMRAIQTELKEIDDTIHDYEDRVEEGATLIANRALIKKRVKLQVQILIKDYMDRDPVLVTLLNGGTYVRDIIQEELRQYNEKAMKDRCSILKIAASNKPTLLYADIVGKFKGPYCVIEYNSNYYLAKALSRTKGSLTKIENPPSELTARFSNVPINQAQKTCKKTHNLIASCTHIPKDRYFDCTHKFLTTKSYDGTEAKKVEVGDIPKGGFLSHQPHVIIDDVYDSGNTYIAVKKELKDMWFVESIELFVLFDKDLIHQDRPEKATYACFRTSTDIKGTIEPFLIGAGMNYLSNRFREWALYAVDENSLPPIEAVKALTSRKKYLEGVYDNLRNALKTLLNSVVNPDINKLPQLPPNFMQGIFQTPQGSKPPVTYKDAEVQTAISTRVI